MGSPHSELEWPPGSPETIVDPSHTGAEGGISSWNQRGAGRWSAALRAGGEKSKLGLESKISTRQVARTQDSGDCPFPGVKQVFSCL